MSSNGIEANRATPASYLSLSTDAAGALFVAGVLTALVRLLRRARS